jgi:N-glycosylation protein.
MVSFPTWRPGFSTYPEHPLTHAYFSRLGYQSLLYVPFSPIHRFYSIPAKQTNSHEKDKPQTLTFLYHATQNHATIKRETTASISVLSIASFISMSSLLLQLHLTRENEPEVPAFVIAKKVWEWFCQILQTYAVRANQGDNNVGGMGRTELWSESFFSSSFFSRSYVIGSGS